MVVFTLRWPSKLLHGTDVVAVLEKVRGEGMPKRMTTRALRHPGGSDGLLDSTMDDGGGKVVPDEVAAAWMARAVRSR
jgi:hypothetical protein